MNALDIISMLLYHLKGLAFMGAVIVAMLVLSLLCAAVERRFGWFFQWILRGTRR